MNVKEKKILNFKSSPFEFKMKSAICLTFITLFLREVTLH